MALNQMLLWISTPAVNYYYEPTLRQQTRKRSFVASTVVDLVDGLWTQDGPNRRCCGRCNSHVCNPVGLGRVGSGLVR